MEVTSGSNLILDFPSSSDARDGSIARSKYVSFSETNLVKEIRYPTNKEVRAKWYSRHDEALFKRRVLQDVRRYSALLCVEIEDESEYLKKELLIRCLGLDHLLSRDIAQKYQELVLARENHKNTVLDAQELQRKHNVDEAEDLARISMASSRYDRERSHRNAFIMGSL